jgi:hypothetical protein
MHMSIKCSDEAETWRAVVFGWLEAGTIHRLATETRRTRTWTVIWLMMMGSLR